MAFETAAERAAAGKRSRTAAHRSAAGSWEPAADRRDPVDVLVEQDAARVPDLVPIRHGRMLASPFAFFRGAAAVMAGDLATVPGPGLDVQLCGDAHLSNFGVYEAPDRRLVFDVNDFDETLPGPFEWDLKRLIASLAIAGRDRGFDLAQRQAVMKAAASAYRESMRAFAGMRDLEVWYARLDVSDALESVRDTADTRAVKRLERDIDKARRKNSLRAFERLTERVDARPRIVSDPPLIVPIEELAGGVEPADIEMLLQELIDLYKKTLAPDRRVIADRYRYEHAARKVVGVGSVGTRAWIILLLGRDDEDPLFLQAKEAGRSVVEPYARRCRFAHQGRRVVEGQRLMQTASDIFLGWLTVQGVDGKERDFYVRQLWDGKRSAEVETMGPDDMGTYGGLCGWTLARAHARSGDRFAIAGYLGSGTVFDDALAEFGEAYADQNERDYEAFAAAVNAGTITAESDL